MLTGHCCCGYVRYRIDGRASKETICHCATCRRASGAPLVAWFTVKGSQFTLLAGEISHFKSSEYAERGFCNRCGTALTFRSSRYPDELDVTTCSLENPEAFPPTDHTYTRSQLSWFKIG